VSVVTMLAVFVLFAREAVGAGQGTRHSLRPLSSRVIGENNSGVSRRGNHCGCLESEWLTEFSRWRRLIQPSCPCLSRAWTPCFMQRFKNVDDRDKARHDEGGADLANASRCGNVDAYLVARPGHNCRFDGSVFAMHDRMKRRP